jgi:hypothetical protein
VRSATRPRVIRPSAPRSRARSRATRTSAPSRPPRAPSGHSAPSVVSSGWPNRAGWGSSPAATTRRSIAGSYSSFSTRTSRTSPSSCASSSAKGACSRGSRTRTSSRSLPRTRSTAGPALRWSFSRACRSPRSSRRSEALSHGGTSCFWRPRGGSRRLTTWASFTGTSSPRTSSWSTTGRERRRV